MTDPRKPSALVLVGSPVWQEVEAALEAMGVECKRVESARDAIDVEKHRLTDLILVDTTSGELDGVAAITQLKGSLDAYVPILALCALGDADTKRRAVEAGTDDFVTLPLTELELTLRVRAILRVRHLADEINQLVVAKQSAKVTDPLTALYNERAMRDFLLMEFARARRYRRNLSLLIVDVDGLHRINEVQGKAIGDQLLRDVANLIRTEVREADITGRVDGTYWILAPETDGDAVMAMAERLRRSANQATAATVSIGVAAMPAVMAASAEALLSLAQTALRRAKAEGRNCCRQA